MSNRKGNCRTFKASPNEAAPLSWMPLAPKLTDVTALLICGAGVVRKVCLG